MCLSFLSNIKFIYDNHSLCFLYKKDTNIKIMNMIIIIIIYIYTLYQLSEYFYYNKKYHTLENIIYTITSVAFFINVIISYTQNKNNVQTQ